MFLHRQNHRTLLATLAVTAASIASTVALASPAAAHPAPRVVRIVSLPNPQLPESITMDRRGDLYLSLNPLKEILRIAPDGTRTTIATIAAGTQSLGVRLDAAGNAYLAVAGSGIWRVPAGGGPPALFAAIPGLPNAMAFDRRGNLYVSESLGGVIYRISRDGSVSAWSSSPLLQGTTGPGPCGLVHPSGLPLGANGIAFNARGTALFVANTTFGTIVRIPVRRGGRAGAARVYAGPDCRLWGADGIAVDRKDNVYVAANAERDIVRVGPGGRLHVLASFAAGAPLYSPSDIVFGTGRRDRTTIFISDFALFTGGVGAGVVTLHVGVGGLPLNG
jgi:sugar lactone lactonase YvrE